MAFNLQKRSREEYGCSVRHQAKATVVTPEAVYVLESTVLTVIGQIIPGHHAVGTSEGGIEGKKPMWHMYSRHIKRDK